MSYFSRSVTTTLSKLWLHTMPARSAPMSCMPSVTHGPSALSDGLVASAWSTASCAILRYVVHLPPQMEMRLPRTTSTTWSRASFFVSFSSEPGCRTSGRRPAHAARTWLWLRGRASVRLHSSRMNSTSLEEVSGRRVTGSRMSVVPAMVLPSHGSRYSTRPSRVNQMQPMWSGEKWSGRMRWEPLAVTMMSLASGSAILRTESAKGPVALMTCLARMSHFSPVIESFTRAPTTL
mmetsp:Transcript_85668/g.228416  ORF Transcript_85668/g.228416 Transcript_85668/m.228416 type:complete len:235 (+) Transcript_85668:402-1106(+)